MGWLSEHFIHKAQESSLAGDIPKEIIPEVLRLVATGKDAVIRLRSPKNGVIEMNEGDFSMYKKKATTYLQENSPEYRASIISILTASSASSGLQSVLSDQSRASIASTNTDASFFSIETKSDRIKKAVTVPTSFKKRLGKPLICPTCGNEFKHIQDLKKHIRDIHEQKPVFQCPHCEETSEHNSAVERHCRRAHPARPHYVHVLPSFDKVAYGCSFCEKPSPDFDTYLKCMEGDQKKNPRLLPEPSKRLRALLRQSDDTLRAIEQACIRRQLRIDTWKEFMWDDDICDERSRRLEYGCNGHDDIHRPGVDDLHEFVELLLDDAKLQSNGCPIVPPKDSTGAVEDTAPTNGAPALNTAPANFSAGPRYQYSSTEPPVFNNLVPYHQSPHSYIPRNMAPDHAAMYHARTLSGIEDAAQESNNQVFQMSRMMAADTAAPQKRHPSIDSTSHPDNCSRAKRHPAADRLALPESNTDRPDSTVLPAASLPWLRPNAGTELPTDPAPTGASDSEATEGADLDPLCDVIDMYDWAQELVVLDGVKFGNYEGFETDQRYDYQPLGDDQDPFWNLQNFGAYYDDWKYYYNDQQPYDNQQI